MLVCSLIKYLTESLFTGVLRGAPASFQLGMSSLSAFGSNTLPESIWAPTSEPFSDGLGSASSSGCGQFYSRRQPRWTGSNDDNIIFHRFSFYFYFLHNYFYVCVQAAAVIEYAFLKLAL